MKTKGIKDFVWTKSSIVCLIVIFLAAMMLVFLSCFFHLNFAHFIKGVGRTDLFAQICNLKLLFLTTKKSMSLTENKTEEANQLKLLNEYEKTKNYTESNNVELREYKISKQTNWRYEKTGQTVLFFIN